MTLLRRCEGEGVHLTIRKGERGSSFSHFYCPVCGCYVSCVLVVEERYGPGNVLRRPKRFAYRVLPHSQ